MENRYNPLISVIIPAYNAQAFIAKTLESVIAQTYSNLEILVVDDGSSDRTVEIIKQFSQQDRRIRLLQQPNGGVASARNLAIKASKGEFIAPIDADDLWHPENIALQVQAMETGGKKVGLVYSWSVNIDEKGQATGGFRATQIAGKIYPTFITHNFIGNASATMMRWSCLEEVGYYNPELRAQKAQGCEDWDLYLRIAEKYEFAVVPAFMVGYRKLSNSMSCDHGAMAKSHKLVMSEVRRRNPELPRYLFGISSSNLYMYFAHQSNNYQHDEITKQWLKEALAAEFFTPWIRPGFYRLILSSTLGKKQQTKPVNDISSTKPKQQNFQTFQAHRFTLNLMLSVENIFHWFIKILAPTASRKLGQSKHP